MKSYETEGLVVYWKPEICQHAGKCVKADANVFRVGEKPWIHLDGCDIEKITKAIDSCPSKALSYERK